ncbi:MAG: DUF547 domain-containing protein [Hyphomicrobiales bacterium]
MRNKVFFAGVTALVLSLSQAGQAQAQSALEKFGVPKAKLISGPWKTNVSGSAVKVDHSAWDAFLKKYVKTGSNGVNLVAYGRVSGGDKAALGSYLKSLQATDVTKLNRNEQFAFWVNLYNASTVNVALKNYPIKSIRDVKKGVLDFLGPFNDKVAKVNGKTLTLNDIESGIVRPLWKDPRLHYAFNCAAVSCPNLGKQAFKGDTLNKQLNSAASRFINNSRGIRFTNGKATASKIFFWYEGDFGGSHKAIINHMKQYASGGLKAKLASLKKIHDFEYDWTLNDAR